MLEVLVALILLAGAMLVVALVVAAAARADDASRETTLATTLAVQKVEQLQALARGMAPDGSNVDDVQSDVADWPNRPVGGTGLSASPPGTLLADAPGFVDYLDGAGGWVGAGSSPPAAAVFARRWAIAPAHASAPDTLLLTVRVCRRPPPRSIVSAGVSGWLHLVQIEAAKTRRGG